MLRGARRIVGGMVSVRQMVVGLGGLAQKRQLVALGATDWMLTHAVRSGDVHRARQGWYSVIPESEPVLRAARVGGRLTGISALIELGCWSWQDHPLHVSVPRRAARLRKQWDRFARLNPSLSTDVALHWDDDGVVSRGGTQLVSLTDTYLRVVLDEPFELAVAALDWGLGCRLLSRTGFEEILRALPQDARMIGNWVDSQCDSILESIARTKLRLHGFLVTSQVPVGVLEHIDLVIEDIVALETDGKDHLGRFEKDRRKDLSITIEGRHPLRATYTMVRYDFGRLVDAIECAIVARHPDWSLENSGTGAHPARRGRRIWRMLDGSCTRLPEFPRGGADVAGMIPRIPQLAPV
jgi:very-short-patch-repair endonuclease